jgi:hypothetical protein
MCLSYYKLPAEEALSVENNQYLNLIAVKNFALLSLTEQSLRQDKSQLTHRIGAANDKDHHIHHVPETSRT